ncbi:MAG: hypothetical protein E7639_06845 [Ruminococcaceae bacterium]|nr:hypothetical protein [Oscillospiraceae bacterium]
MGIFFCVVALAIGGILSGIFHASVPIIIALVYVGTFIVWSISDDHPKFNAFITFVVGLVNAIVFISTGKVWLFFLLLAWIGYVKTHRVWGEYAYYDYVTIDEKIYAFFDDSTTTTVHVIATLLSIGFYCVLGFAALSAPSLAFIPVVWLGYRTIRVFMAAE